MAKLTYLPDEVLTMIFSEFKVSKQWGQYLRPYEGVDHADISRRANLAAFARVCKRFSTIAGSLLNKKTYLYLDMRSLEAYLAEENLALLSRCSVLQHLICDIQSDRSDPFLTCLASICAPLQGLSLTIWRAGDKAVNLQSLSLLTDLQGLELRFRTGANLSIPPSFRLPHLKELYIRKTATFAQTVAALSLASTQGLRHLWLLHNCLTAPPGTANIWSQTLGHRRFHQVQTLCMSTRAGEEISHDVLGDISTYFPNLEEFVVCYNRLDSVQCHNILSTIPTNVTYLQISPTDAEGLRLLLLSITEDIKLQSKLEIIRILMGVRSWEGGDRNETIQLSRDARQAALSRGIQLQPLDLIEALERMPL